MNKVIIPTGYMGTGSSAITDIVREYEGYEARNNSFEYIFLHCPDGVFDLEDKLLVGNNTLRSDEAIHSFLRRMETLFYHKIWWPANYQKRLHPEFLNYVQKYVNDLVQFTSDNAWYMQLYPTKWMILRNGIRRLLLLVSNDRIKLKYLLRYGPMKLSFVKSEEFYLYTQSFVYEIFQLMGLDKQNLILDQLLLPHNVWRMDNYFKDNVECIIVERDVRDLFILNKYIWPQMNETVPYPTDVIDFCNYYRRVREIERKEDSVHVHRLWFEDLIYKYEESLEKIEKILAVNNEKHVYKKAYFNPDKSINNTQFYLQEKYSDEIRIIEERMPEFLYEFPYKREPMVNKSF